MTEELKILVRKSYLKKLKKRVENLKVLTEVSASISSTLDIQELMTIVMEKAKSVMNAEACSVLLYNRDTKKLEFEIALCKEESASDVLKKKISLEVGQGIAGWVAKNKEILIIKDVKTDKRFFQEADKITGFVTKSIIAAPLMGRRGLIGVAEIINPKKKDYDPEVLNILSKHIAIAIENALYHKESLEKERLKQELEIASILQKSFLPEKPSYTKGNISAFAVNIPAKLVGGDLYDFSEPVDGKVGVFIGDVSGKGISAALYMAKIIGDFRYSSHMVESPEIVMNRLNSILSNAPRGMFLTSIYLIADVETGKIKISVAGHPPFLLISRKKVQAVSVDAGPPLGIMPLEYQSSNISLTRGDRIILLTDGVIDAKNKEGKRLGFDNLITIVQNNLRETPCIDFITKYVSNFSKGVEKADDLTMVEIAFS